MKELATQTARATQEIQSHIGRIHGSTEHAVLAIGAIAARIRETNGMAIQIAAAVEEQGAATQEIVRNIAQAATGTSGVTGNIKGVADAAAASLLLTSASELSRQSEHLDHEVARFHATVRAAWSQACTEQLVLTDWALNSFENYIDPAVHILHLPDSNLVAARLGAVTRVVCRCPTATAHGTPRAMPDLASIPCVAFA